MKVVQIFVSCRRGKTCQIIRQFRSSRLNVFLKQLILNLIKIKSENWKPRQSSLKIPVIEFCLSNGEGLQSHPWPSNLLKNETLHRLSFNEYVYFLGTSILRNTLKGCLQYLSWFFRINVLPGKILTFIRIFH